MNELIGVSAITTTTVDVAITAPEKDVLGATVVVKDSKGNTVEVNPVDISAGDKVAAFTFKTAVKDADLVGVWTVDGKEYNLDAVNQLADIMDAAEAQSFSEVKLYNALTAASIKNVDDNRVSAYRTALVDASPETLADVQKTVDAVNKKAGEVADETAATKAVKEATNQIQLLAALEANFDRVNADWVAAYAAGATDAPGIKINPSGTDNDIFVDGSNTSNDEDFAAIQKAVDAVNFLELKKSVDAATADLDSKKVAEARTLVTAYAEDAKEGELGQKDAVLDSLKFQDALIAADKATTNNSLKKALTDLNSLEDQLIEKYKGTGLLDKTKKIDLKLVNDNLLADYREALKKETDVTKKNTRGKLMDIIKQVNSNSTDALVKAVQDEAKASNVDADKLVKALQNLGVKQVAASNKATYAASKTTYASVADTAAAQKQVDKDNVAAIKALTGNTDGDKIIAALNVLELKNVKPENKAAYIESAKVTTGGADGDTIGQSTTATKMQEAVNKVNDAEAIKAAVADINKAETATQVKTALDTLANKGELTDYLNVTPADRIFIAEQVLDARDELKAYADDTTRDSDAVAKKFFDADEVDTAVTEATDARTGTLVAVNALGIDDSLTDIANALLLVGHESLTGEAGSVLKNGTVTPGTVTANDTDVANSFITSVGFDDQGAITPQFRSINEIRTAITNAVK